MYIVVYTCFASNQANVVVVVALFPYFGFLVAWSFNFSAIDFIKKCRLKISAVVCM